MESDARLPSPEGNPPPADDGRVWRWNVWALGLAGLAVALAVPANLLDEPPGFVASVRVWAATLGVLLSGCAVSVRWADPVTWLLGAAACLAAVFGFPATWDSARLLAAVLAGAAFAGAVLLWLPRPVRLTVVSVAVLVHFGGILTAVTMPTPTPWLTQQLWGRFYRPYLELMYLKNAYHFYSPDPGPASQMWFCVEYDARTRDGALGGALVAATRNNPLRWVRIPNRPGDVRDPLGMTYYRRLALTEQLPMNRQTTNPNNTEVIAARKRRTDHTQIPFSPTDPTGQNSYMPPGETVTNLLLPSYARHAAREFGRPGLPVRTVKIYFVIHEIIAPERFAKEHLSPYDPTTYRVYFQGEFDPEGRLMDPMDPMLYWHVPIVARPRTQFLPGQRPVEGDVEYDNYVKTHAGSDPLKGEVEP